MQLTLRDITPDNFVQCLNLDVLPHQHAFVASTMFCLAEAKANPALTPLAIYENDTMVGFVMYEFVPREDQVAFLSVLLIDGMYQGKGYGHAALEEVARRLALTDGCFGIWASVAEQNEAAMALCKRVGFETTNQKYYEESVEFLDISPFRVRKK